MLLVYREEQERIDFVRELRRLDELEVFGLRARVKGSDQIQGVYFNP